MARRPNYEQRQAYGEAAQFLRGWAGQNTDGALREVLVGAATVIEGTQHETGLHPITQQGVDWMVEQVEALRSPKSGRG